MKIKMDDVRLAFHKGLFEKQTFAGEAGGKASYQNCFIFDEDHPCHAALLKAEEAVAKEKWGDKADRILKSIRENGKGVVQNGDKRNSAGFEGMKFVSAHSDVRPTVVDRDRSPLTLEDGKIYSGCYVNGIGEVWAQDNSFGKRINFQVTGVQFRRDGDSFGGGKSAASADDFEALSADDGGSDDPMFD